MADADAGERRADPLPELERPDPERGRGAAAVGPGLWTAAGPDERDDDQTGELYRASVLWQREREAGVALRPAADDDRSRMVAAELRRKYYAVRD